MLDNAAVIEGGLKAIRTEPLVTEAHLVWRLLMHLGEEKAQGPGEIDTETLTIVLTASVVFDSQLNKLRDPQAAVPSGSDLRELGDHIRPYRIRRNHPSRHRVCRGRRQQQTGEYKKGR